MGDGTGISVNHPIQVSILTDVSVIAAGEAHSLARKNDGTAWAWGSNLNGELGNGNNTSSKVPVQVGGLCPVLKINEITEQVSVSVFPNPSKGQFTLILAKDKGTVEIYNMLGGKVYRSEIKNQKSEINLSNQPKGMYLITFYEGQKMRTEKIVIQ